jgi:hypothetical protein
VKGSDTAILIGYVDAAYANATKKRSTSGYIFMLAGGPVSWSSRKQPITALSSTEAEYIAAADGAKQAVWLCHFIYSVGKQRVLNGRPTPFYMDNQSSMRLSQNPVEHTRSKHIHVRYHAIRDSIEHGEIAPIYTHTKKMLADSITKAADKDTFGRLIKSLRFDG